MIPGTPYLRLVDPQDPQRSFTYFAHPDGESVNLLFRDAEGPVPIGPWSQAAAARHAAHLRQAGYQAVDVAHRPEGSP